MKNLTISKKLVFSFAILFVVSATIGISAIIGGRNLSASQERIFSNNMMGLHEIGNIRANYQRQRVLVRESVLYEEQGMQTDAVERLHEVEAEMEGHLKQYQQTIEIDTDRKAFDAFAALYHNEFAGSKREVMNLGGENSPEQRIAALEVNQALSLKMSEYLDICLDANVRLARNSISDGRQDMFRLNVMEGIILGVGIIISIIIVIFLQRNITRPLQMMLQAAKKISQGDVNVTIDYNGNDEVGQLAAAFQNMASMLLEQTMMLNRISQGDLSTDVKVMGDHDLIGNAMKNCSDNLNRIMREINSAAAQVTTGAEQVSESSQMLAQGASEQAAAIEQLSSSIFEISLNTKESAKMSEALAVLFQGINTRASESSVLMRGMTDSIEAVKAATTNISKIMKLMGDISFQTNILSINAAVEAANAGEYGRGFAVVADEVRNLARRSSQAAADTQLLIEDCVQTVQSGTDIIQKTNETLRGILTDVVLSARHIDDIAQATNEQSASIEQINMGIDQVSKVINLNSSSAEQSAMAAEEMAAMAENVAKLIANFKLRNTEVPIVHPYIPKTEVKRQTEKPVIILADEKSDKY